MSDDEIPTWDSIEPELSRLDELLAGETIDAEIREALEQIPLSGLHLIRVEAEILRSVFRARQPSAKEDIELVSTFSSPPVRHSHRQRANLQGFPVFYASLLIDTAIQEMIPPGTDLATNGIVFVGEWTTDAPANIQQFLHPAHASKSEALGDYHYGTMESLRVMLKEYSVKKQVTLERLAGRLGDYFLKPGDYRVSSQLAHQALYEFNPPGPHRVDAIVYPSIVKENGAVNFAIAPRFATEHLTLKEVKKYQVTRVSQGGCDAKLLAVGRPNGVRVDWFEPYVDYSHILRKASKFVGEPDSAMEYKSNHVQIDGRDVAIEELWDECWKRNRPRAMEYVLAQLFEAPLQNEPRQVTLQQVLRNREFKYQGKFMDELVLSFLVEFDWKLKPLQHTPLSQTSS